MRAILMQNMLENMWNLAKYELKYAANMQSMRHMCGILFSLGTLVYSGIFLKICGQF